MNSSDGQWIFLEGIENLDMAILKLVLLPVREDLKNPISLGIQKPLETFDFQEPYGATRSPKLWRELSHSEKNGRTRRWGAGNSNQQIAAILG